MARAYPIARRAGMYVAARLTANRSSDTIWVAFFVFALGSPRGWIAVYCPLLMFWFLYKVTGIPATEAHSVATKGDAYREYQRTTSAFVPLPPKDVM